MNVCVHTTAKTAINPHEPGKMMPSVGQKSNLTNHIDKAPKARNPFDALTAQKGKITRTHTHTRSSKHTYGRYKLALITLYRGQPLSPPTLTEQREREGERQLSIHAVSLNFDIFLFVFGFAITH